MYSLIAVTLCFYVHKSINLYFIPSSFHIVLILVFAFILIVIKKFAHVFLVQKPQVYHIL